MGKKILIVEDHPEVRRALSLNLRHHCYEILEASTGCSGVALAKTERPDLLLVDLSLPDLTGLEIARAIKINPQTADIPLVALSGCGERDIALQALRAGVAEYLMKPVDIQRLVEVIERLTSLSDLSGPPRTCS
jgi:CheY-like chemotaxis protein